MGFALRIRSGDLHCLAMAGADPSGADYRISYFYYQHLVSLVYSIVFVCNTATAQASK